MTDPIAPSDRAARPRITLSLTPLKPALPDGEDAVLDVLVRLQAPDAPQDAPRRPPLDLALTLDRSGSMSGAPLIEAKRCAKMIVDALGPEDHLAIVAFAGEVEVVAPRMPASDKAALRRAIDRIGPAGLTALHGGWLKGAELIAEAVRPGAVSRVLLLSDGCANVGLNQPEMIAAQAEQLRGAGVSTSTYGLGRRFDEVLMTALAAAGGGKAYYGKTAADLMGEFRAEFDLLSALCAREATLKLTPSAGVLVDVLNDLPQDGAAWRLPDLAYDAEAWAVLRLRVAAEHIGALDGAILLEAKASARDLEGRAAAIESAALTLPARSPEAFAALPEDPLVKARAQEAEAARLQTRARLAAERGDWDAAERSMLAAEERTIGNAYATASLMATRRLLEARDQAAFAKEARYKTDALSRRLAGKRERLAYSMSDELDAAPRYLQRKAEQGRDLAAQAAEAGEPNAPDRAEDKALRTRSRRLRSFLGDGDASRGGAKSRDRDRGETG